MTKGISDFPAFYRHHAPDVFRFALYLTRNHAEAEDITSETFVRLWTSAATIDVTSVQGYLTTIARNIYLHSLRRGKRNVDMSEELGDPRAGPLRNAEARSDLEAVADRLVHCSDIDRAAFLLRVIEGTPYEEIARTLAISVSAAKVKIHRVRLALADLKPTS